MNSTCSATSRWSICIWHDTLSGQPDDVPEAEAIHGAGNKPELAEKVRKTPANPSRTGRNLPARQGACLIEGSVLLNRPVQGFLNVRPQASGWAASHACRAATGM